MQDKIFILPSREPVELRQAPGSNLPAQLTSFIGREKEVAAACTLLRRPQTRLLTLTGTGGVGKTRLGLQVAADLLDDFADGVYFIPLAPISDPELVMPSIAQTLGIWEVGVRPLLEQLKAYLQEKQLLLLLDNFEQVVDAAVQVANLLAACLKLKVIVTSRAVLHVRGEQEFAVPPLAVPDPTHLPDLVVLSQYEAVALFILRTQAVKPEFQVTNANAPAIAEICARLDGLPLAIELAAARIKLLPPPALLARLGQRLAVLTSGVRDVPARQQTLRNTIAWSYDLLNADERRLFQRLSVFVGGSALEAIEAVCHGAGDKKIDVLNTVASLIDKSLVHQTEQEGEEPRVSMLETVREYGWECLHEYGEAHASQRAHTLYYLAFAEQAEPHLKGAQQVLWWKRLEREQENLRAALTWLIGQEEGELALRLSVALWWFWYIRGYWSEGWRWLEATLGLPQAQGQTASRAKALHGAGEFAYRLGRHLVANSLLEQSVAISRELGDKSGLSQALGGLGLGLFYHHSTQAAARTLLEESLALAREVGYPWMLANALRNGGVFMRDYGDYKNAHLHLEESVVLYRTLKDRQALSGTLRELSDVVLFEGQLTQAGMLAEESLALARELNNGPDLTRALYRMATIRAFQDHEQAAVLYEESLALAREQGDTIQMGNALFTLASIAVLQGDLTQAETYVQESLALFRALGGEHKMSLSLALSVLGEIRRKQGNLTQAKAVYKEGLVLAREAGRNYSIAWNLIGLARVASDEGQPEQAARLFGAAEPLLNPGVEMDPTERADYERAVEDVRARLGEKAFATAWAQGRTMSPDQVLAALEPTMMVTMSPTETSLTPSAKAPTTYSYGLTEREVEVLRLVAQGLTNPRIAERLIISSHTVNAHVRSIYNKLNVTSRSTLTR